MPGSVCLSGACVCPAGSRQSGSSCLGAGLALLTNVGWTATSSVAAADSGPDVPAANVLDGNECTRFSTGASQQSGDWLALDLGGPTVFDEVVLDGFLDPNDFPAAFSIFVSNDGTSWGAAIAGGAGSATGSAVVNVTLPEQNARYLKVQLTASASNAWSVDELRLYSAHPPLDTPVPLPRSQWNATALIGAGTAQLALDGNPATHFTTGVAAAAGNWFQVDLGTFVTFDELTMNSYDSCFDSARTYTVTVSNDGTTWQGLFMGDATGPIVTATFPAQTARYIRVELTMAYVQFWSIGEFNAYMPSH
jgi:endo-1,3(4)-beta-glucanase